jgi:hypothetical protein
MATQILADGTSTTPSADVVVTSTLAVALKDYAQDACVIVFLKDDAAAYQRVGQLTADNPGKSISAPGTYRFTRATNSGTCGVFSG